MGSVYGFGIKYRRTPVSSVSKICGSHSLSMISAKHFWTFRNIPQKIKFKKLKTKLKNPYINICTYLRKGYYLEIERNLQNFGITYIVNDHTKTFLNIFKNLKKPINLHWSQKQTDLKVTWLCKYNLRIQSYLITMGMLCFCAQAQKQVDKSKNLNIHGDL